LAGIQQWQDGAVAKRTRLSREDRRAQLIELGVEMLATRRLDELSVELIAQTAGISRGLLFHYFASKQDFHREVARAAAAEMLRRTEPDAALSPVEALRSALTSFVDYVEENPDNYKSLVRGAASGDAEMRALFDETRTALAQRIIGVVADLGLEVAPRVDLAIHGWVAYVEECVIRWLDTRTFPRDELLDLLTKSLPAVALSATDEQVGTLVAILTADAAIGTA
jgi:AcrR family transcriptional regulator